MLRWRPPSWPAMNRGRCRCPEMRTSPRRSRSGSRYVLYVQGLINESSRREIALRKYSACLEVHDCCVYSTSCSKHVPGIADPSLRSQPCRRQYTPGVNWEGSGPGGIRPAMGSGCHTIVCRGSSTSCLWNKPPSCHVKASVPLHCSRLLVHTEYIRGHGVHT